MGDDRRFAILASFVERNFPPSRFPTVADVAGGTGLLALELIRRGYRATVIDPRRSGLPGHIRKQERKAALKTGRLLRPTYMQADVCHADLSGFDLLVGLHPNEATEPIARLAKQKPVVLVPCCNKGFGIVSHGSPNATDTVRRIWQGLGVQWRETQLPMTGKNVVLWTKGDNDGLVSVVRGVPE